MAIAIASRIVMQRVNNNYNDEQITTKSSLTDKEFRFVTERFAPYAFEENGHVRGISVDIAREAFKRLGYPDIQIDIYPLARALEMVRNGEAHGVFSIYKTPSRERWANFSREPMLDEEVSLFVLKEANINFDGDLLKLTPYTFGVVRKYSYQKKFDNAVQKGILKADPADTGEACIEKLLNRRIDIFISNKFVALEMFKRMGKLDQIKELSPEVYRVSSYFAFSKRQSLLLTEDFDKVIEEMKQDGTYYRIINDYIKK